MPRIGESPKSKPKWRLLYEAAILEIEPDKVPKRIIEAQEAITSRLQNLGISDTERLALLDARNVLCDLCKMCGLDDSRLK